MSDTEIIRLFAVGMVMLTMGMVFGHEIATNQFHQKTEWRTHR